MIELEPNISENSDDGRYSTNNLFSQDLMADHRKDIYDDMTNDLNYPKSQFQKS